MQLTQPTQLTAMEQYILWYLKKGENFINKKELATELSLSISTVYKNLKLLEQKNLIKKIATGRKGGSAYDSRWQTIIIKL